ncbi:MAG: hypothetical protein ABIV13_01575 [Fimbriimonadales bacterium]
MRKLSIPEILDESFAIYRSNFGLLFSIALIPNVVLAAFGAILGLQIVAVNEQDFGQMLNIFAIAMLVLVIGMLAMEIANGAMTSAISEKILGRSATIGSSYGRVGRRMGEFIGYLFLKYLVIFVGLMFCFIPGIIFSILLYVSICAFVIENMGPKEALERSWALVKNDFFRVLGIAIIIGIISWVISFAVNFLFSLVVSGSVGAAASSTVEGSVATTSMTIAILGGVIQGLAAAAVAPLMAAVVTITYYDLRVRKEGFDLERLAESLGGR